MGNIKDIETNIKEHTELLKSLTEQYKVSYSELTDLQSLLAKERETFFNLKEGDLLQLTIPTRVGKYGFIDRGDGNIKMEIHKVTEYFIRGEMIEGVLVAFKGKGDKYYRTGRKNFAVNKKGFITMLSSNSTLGKILDRDSEIDNLLK